MPELDSTSTENEDLLDVLWMHRIKQMRQQISQERKNTGQVVSSAADDDITQEVNQKVKASFPDELRRR